MLSSSQRLVDTEDKEKLDKEGIELHKFASECKELLHIKNLLDFDINKLKTEYVRYHADLCKDELIIRTDMLEDLVYFLKNYK